MKCAIYARVSTELDSQKESITNQISYFTHYVEEKGWSIHDIYRDEGVSGTSIKKRSEMLRLLQDARNKEFDYVLIKSISRFARDNKDGFDIKRELDELGIGIIFIEQNLDTRINGNELIFGIYLNLAQEESKQISERTSFGKKEKARRGKFNGSLPPFGYLKSTDGTLTLHPEYAPIVKCIFALYLYENWGVYKIANYLNNLNVPTPRNVVKAKNAGSLWLQSSLKLILTNPIYTGHMIQNRSKKVNLRSNKRTTIPIEDQIVAPNTHEAIITQEEFSMVQKKLKDKGKNKSNGKENLFAHIAVCSDCGKGMHYRKDRKGYICGTYSKHGKKYCSSHQIKADTLLNIIKQDLNLLSLSNIDEHRLLKKASHLILPQTNTMEKELSAINKKLNTLTKRQTTLLDLLTDGSLTKEEWTTQNNLLREELSTLNNKKLELSLLIKNTKGTEDSLNALKKELHHILTLNLSDEKLLRFIIHKLISKIEVSSSGKPKIYYNFQNPGA